MPKYDLTTSGGRRAPQWYEDRGEDYYDPVNGGLYPKTGVAVQDSVIAEKYEDLDHSKWLIDPDSPAGWLSPRGKFYGCACQNHVLVARLVIRMRVRDMEQRGWIHVGGLRALLHCHRFPTAEQRNWVAQSDHGYRFDIDENTDYD